MDPSTVTLANLLDYAMRGSVIGMFVFFVWASKNKVIVWGYQLDEANKRADKWETLFLEQKEINRGALQVAAKTTGVQP